jgi:homoserine O-succinyltransferase/O-acetyltransferase
MLTIGILNSMPETAVRSTERQLGEVLTEAAGRDIPLHLRWFSLEPREGYEPLRDLWTTNHIDGLFATGTEPKASRLSDEPYWSAFIRTIDWATTHTTSAVWSCLGAHAAVLHLDGVQRCPFSAKLHGVFAITKQEHHPLLLDTEQSWGVPHSRWNDLPLQGLLSRGYQILTHAVEAGADLFAKNCGESLFVFFQGHPEYDARALMREYRRDVLRFLTGERANYPDIPAHYFDVVIERQLLVLRERALTGRDPDYGMVDFQTLMGKAVLTPSWKPAAMQLYRNWFNVLTAAQRSKLSLVPVAK